MANSNHFFMASCFHPSQTTTNHRKEPPSARRSNHPNLSTSLYYTDFGLFTITWSSTLLGHFFHLHHLDDENALSTTLPPFHLHMNTFLFWKKRGSKKMKTCNGSREVHVFWDLRRSSFGPRPESGFYLAVVISGQMALLVGDLTTKAYRKTKVKSCGEAAGRALVYKSEHVYGKGVYRANARLGGRNRVLTIEDSNFREDRVLYFSIDSKVILQVDHLKWKFRGSVRVEVENFVVNVSWDVYDWLFDKEKKTSSKGRNAVFLFKFQDKTYGGYENFQGTTTREDFLQDEKTWTSQFERMKMRRKNSLMRGRNGNWSSSSSMSSSFSSRSNSSVLEWETMEEKQLQSTTGLSLLVHAWKK